MVAVAAVAAATSIHRQDFKQAVVVPKIGYVNISRKTRSSKAFIASSSEGDEIGTTTTATTNETQEDESQVEVQEERQYFINALNVEKAIRGISISNIDYYGTLGLRKGCSNDEVTAAYKKKLEEVMNEELEEEESSKRVELLKESYTILSSVEDRRLYDWSLARKGNPETYVWPFEVDKTPMSTELPPQQEEEDVGPTQSLGYFLLGWIVLASILSIALNR